MRLVNGRFWTLSSSPLEKICHVCYHTFINLYIVLQKATKIKLLSL